MVFIHIMDIDKHINFEQEIKIMRIRLSQLRRIIKEEVEALVNEPMTAEKLHDYLEAGEAGEASEKFKKRWNEMKPADKEALWDQRKEMLMRKQLKRSGLTMSSADGSDRKKLGLSNRSPAEDDFYKRFPPSPVKF